MFNFNFNSPQVQGLLSNLLMSRFGPGIQPGQEPLNQGQNQNQNQNQFSPSGLLSMQNWQSLIPNLFANNPVSNIPSAPLPAPNIPNPPTPFKPQPKFYGG